MYVTLPECGDSREISSQSCGWTGRSSTRIDSFSRPSDERPLTTGREGRRSGDDSHRLGHCAPRSLEVCPMDHSVGDDRSRSRLGEVQRDRVR